MVVFIGQLCQPNQNSIETKLSKLCLLSQLKPLLKLFSSASTAAIRKNHEIFLGGPYQPNIDSLYFTLTQHVFRWDNNTMYSGAQDWIVPNHLQTKFLFKCQTMALILGMPVISNYRNNTIKMGHHQKRAINNRPLLFSNGRVDKANSNGYNHRPITRSAELGVHRNF